MTSDTHVDRRRWTTAIGLAITMVIAGITLMAGQAQAADKEPSDARPGTSTSGDIAVQAAWYRTWATNVNVRDNFRNTAYCDAFPGATRCPDVVDHVNPSDAILVTCQRPGQVVSGNPYWLMVRTPRGNEGWMASYYINYPSNRLPDVPDCWW